MGPPLMSNVRPQSPRMSELERSSCTARARARIQMPRARCLTHPFQPDGGAASRLGCPSFGGHRTLAVARTRGLPFHASHGKFAEQELKIARSSKRSTGTTERSATGVCAALISSTAAVHHGSDAPVRSRAIPTVSKFGARSASVSSPVRSNRAVKRTPKSYAFVCRLPLRWASQEAP